MVQDKYTGHLLGLVIVQVVPCPVRPSTPQWVSPSPHVSSVKIWGDDVHYLSLLHLSFRSPLTQLNLPIATRQITRPRVKGEMCQVGHRFPSWLEQWLGLWLGLELRFSPVNWKHDSWIWNRSVLCCVSKASWTPLYNCTTLFLNAGTVSRRTSAFAQYYALISYRILLVDG